MEDLASRRERLQRLRLAGACASAPVIGRGVHGPGVCAACGAEWPCMGAIIGSQYSDGSPMVADD